jgi:hypothetical protein
MPLMNATPLKHARKDKWFAEYGGGEGFETWQLVLGFAVFAIVCVVLWIPLSWFGIGLGITAGFFTPRMTNLMDTHHKHPRKYLEGLVKKRLNHSLILNDKRVPEPRVEIEKFLAEVLEFQPTTPKTND